MKTSKRTPKTQEILIDPHNVTGVFLGKILGLSAVHVSRLSSEGVIKQNGKGQAKYDLTEAVPMYIEKKSRSGTASAKARLAVQQERKLRLLNDREAGTVVALDDAADALLRCCLVWRSGAAALPRRLATKLSHTKRAADIRRILTEELGELLDEFTKPLDEYLNDAGYVGKVVTPRLKRPATAARKNARPVGKRRKNTTARKRGTRKVSKRKDALHDSDSARGGRR